MVGKEFREALLSGKSVYKAGANNILHSSDMFLFGEKLTGEMNIFRTINDDKIINGGSSDNV